MTNIDQCAQRFALNTERRRQLIGFLSELVLDQRLALFHRVLDQRTRRVAVLLENIYQAQNASAVLRSCECLGVQDVHVVEQRNQFVVDSEVDMSASKWLTITHHADTAQTIATLRQRGYRIVATSPHATAQTPESIDLATGPIALMFGTELSGLSPQALALADEHLLIPMHGFIESFNISVSAAICLYTLITRLRTSGLPMGLSAHERDDLLLRWLLQSVKRWPLLVQRFEQDKQ
ncbi:MAG: RNA methyltransferase [Bacteroidales bacterium]|nr:RNA methyltransferase [Bacteroidales bacterium]